MLEKKKDKSNIKVMIEKIIKMKTEVLKQNNNREKLMKPKFGFAGDNLINL